AMASDTLPLTSDEPRLARGGSGLDARLGGARSVLAHRTSTEGAHKSGLAALYSGSGHEPERFAGADSLGARMGRALLAGGLGLALLRVTLWVLPGKMELASSGVARPMAQTYADGLTLLGADVQANNDGIHVSAAFRAARRVQGGTRAAVRFMTRDEVWASASQPLPTQGWRAGQVRRVDFD